MTECQLCEKCPFDMAKKEIVYEIHITVNNKETFADDCYALGIKPIIIDIGEGLSPHAMTSTTIKGGNDAAAHHTAQFLANALREQAGYEIQRIKIETVPWHPEASRPSANQYFETHFAVLIEGDNYLLDEFLKYANSWLHRSRNLLKRENSKVQMLTYRKRAVSNAQYLGLVDNVKERMEAFGLKLDKVISEFVLYDSNEKMDDEWLKSHYQN